MTDSNMCILLSQIRECFGRVAYSHKTHEKQADIFLFRDSLWKWAQIILSILASGSFFAIFSDWFGYEKWWILVGGVLSAILSIINLWLKNSNYEAAAEKHKEIAVRLWDIREKYISLIADIMAGSISIEDVKKNRDELQKSLSIVYKNAPRTTEKAYTKAQEALKLKEDLTFSSNEIDLLLPNSLRACTQDKNGGKQ